MKRTLSIALILLQACTSTSADKHEKKDSVITHVIFKQSHQVFLSEVGKTYHDSLVDDNGSSKWVRDSSYFFYYTQSVQDLNGKPIKNKAGRDSMTIPVLVPLSKSEVLLDLNK